MRCNWWALGAAGVHFLTRQGGGVAVICLKTNTMATSRMSGSSSLYEIASRWDTAIDTERAPLRVFIESLVKYPCKIAAQPLYDGEVHLIVFNITTDTVQDYLELQPNGAIGVVFHLYDNPDSEEVGRLSDACDDHNAAAGVEFESDSEGSDTEGSDSESDEEEG